MALELEDGELFDLDPTVEQVYTLDPGFPTPSDARSMSDDGGSPFLFNSAILGERFPEYSHRVSGFYDFYENSWLKLKRLTQFFLDSNWQRFDALLVEIIDSEPTEITDLIRYDSIYRFYDIALASMAVYPLHAEMRKEWNGLFIPTGNHAEEIAAYQEGIISDPEYLQSRKSLFGCLQDYIELGDALIPGIAIEMYPLHHSQYGDLRIYRDNFPVLRDLYVQSFEACIQALTFVIESLNVIKRGNPHSYLDQAGIRQTPRTRAQFNRLTAEKKLLFLSELPLWESTWNSSLDRQSRNKIGHRQIHHDLSSGTLRREGQDDIPYIDFIQSAQRVFYPIVGCLNALKIAEIHHLIRVKNENAEST
jgi:hypothetical protein